MFDLRAKRVQKCVSNKCACACNDVLLTRGFHVHIIYACTNCSIYFNHTMPFCCLRVMLMVLCRTEKELDIREEKIRKKLRTGVFRILLKVTCRYKCITRTWAYAHETCLAIYMRVKCVQSRLTCVLCA